MKLSFPFAEQSIACFSRNSCSVVGSIKAFHGNMKPVAKVALKPPFQLGTLTGSNPDRYERLVHVYVQASPLWGGP